MEVLTEDIIFSFCVAVFVIGTLIWLHKRDKESVSQKKENNKVEVSAPADIAKRVETKLAEFVREHANVRPGDLTYGVYRRNVCVKFYVNHCAVCWNWNDGEYVEDEVYYADYPNPAQSREYVQQVKTAVLAIRNPEFTIQPDAKVIFRKTESSTIM